VPTLTATPIPTLQDVPTLVPTPEDTPLPEDEPIIIEPLLGEEIAPPLDIDIPDEWLQGFNAITINDLDGRLRSIPLAVYTGPVAGGTGFIIVLWGFPNVTAGNPFAPETGQINLWSDGLRMLRQVVVDRACNLGTDLQMDYTVGGLLATGTQFAAVDCSGEPDTRGWFAGLQVDKLNFVFYVYTEPIEAMGTAESELQAILDTVQFRVDELITEP
jgi:hypothetical protein